MTEKPDPFSEATKTKPLHAEQGLVTMVNSLSVDPERHIELVDQIMDLTVHALRRRPGFVSSRIHASLDGTSVVHATQWVSADDYLAALEDPGVGARVRRAVEMAEDFDSNLYRVVASAGGTAPAAEPGHNQAGSDRAQ